MKKIIKFLCVGVLMSVLGAGIVACRNDDRQEKESGLGIFPKVLESAPVELVQKESLPEWLRDKIEILEADDTDFVTVWRGEWNGKVIYYYLPIVSSCIYCDIYFEDGTQLKWGGNDSSDFENFCSESKNWRAIYQIGETLPSKS
jgi:hypothetical protein